MWGAVSMAVVWLYVVIDVCFLFKQKTAYEMRISDWSSDVCSSDLMVPTVSLSIVLIAPAKRAVPEIRFWLVSSLTALVSDMPGISTISAAITTVLRLSGPTNLATRIATVAASIAEIASLASRRRGRVADTQSTTPTSSPIRSEEHTSELQSLMRISYAVFCLKKKTKSMNNATT